MKNYIWYLVDENKIPVGYLHHVSAVNEDEAYIKICGFMDTLGQVGDNIRYKNGELSMCLTEIEIKQSWELNYEGEEEK